jgi:hypothetical protein
VPDGNSNIKLSRTAMAEKYPSLDFRLDEAAGKSVGVWEGWLQPIRYHEGLNGVVCDLDGDRGILIDRESASIVHSPKCTANHEKHPVFDCLKRPDRPFHLRIEYTGGATHPRAWLLDPVVTHAMRYHIYEKNRICAYPPHTDAWRAKSNTVADFTDQVLVWTFKWNTWVETGYWLGSEEDHDSLHLFATIAPEIQCWCGSGKSYDGCCQSQDRERTCLKMTTMLRARSPLLQVPLYDLSALERICRFS